MKQSLFRAYSRLMQPLAKFDVSRIRGRCSLVPHANLTCSWRRRCCPLNMHSYAFLHAVHMACVQAAPSRLSQHWALLRAPSVPVQAASATLVWQASSPAISELMHPIFVRPLSCHPP